MIVFMLSLCATASALEFETIIAPETQTIRLNESAHYTIEVSHDSQKTEYFEIYTPDVVWDFTTDPAGDRLLEVKAGEKKMTHLVVTPLYVKPGFYGVGFTIKHSGGTAIDKRGLMIGVVPEIDVKGQYSPSVFSEVKFNSKIDPREPLKIYITLKNQNRRNLESIEIKLRSDHINKDIKTSLGPLQEKTLEIEIDLNHETPPAEGKLQATIFTKSRDKVSQFDLPSKKYSIIPYGTIVIEEEFRQDFLTSTRLLKFENTANTLRDKFIEQNVTYVQSWFLDSTPSPVMKKVSGGYIYQWEILLDAGEKTELTIKTNYKNIFWVFVIVFAVFLFYVNFRSPLIVKKTALVIERQQGGVSQLKVLITIKNRTARSVKGLVIKDKVPAIASIARDHAVGSLKPEKVMHYENGEALLKWKLAHIDGKEERILSYTIRTKLHVLGNLALPPAKIGYKFFGWERRVSSKVEKLYR